jgi:hypothetical protein
VEKAPTPHVFGGVVSQQNDNVQVAEFTHKLVLISVNKTWDQPGLDPYDAVRYSWVISRTRAEEADYILAVRQGVIVGAFEAEEWLPATDDEFSNIPPYHRNLDRSAGRLGFRGHPAPDEVKRLYVSKRVPDGHRHHQNPIRYVDV